MIEVMLEKGEDVPESDAPEVVPHFYRLAHTLQSDHGAELIFEAAKGRTC